MKSAITLLLFSACLLPSCSRGGGGGGGPNVPLSALSGSWVGQERAGNGTAAKVQITMDANGNLTAFLVGGQSQGTGELEKEQPLVFSFKLSQGGNGVLYVDPSLRYVLYVSSQYGTGLLQKDAAGLPTYSVAEIVGKWSGQSIFCTSGFDYRALGTSSAEFRGDGTYSIEENGSVFGTLSSMKLFGGHVYEAVANSKDGDRVVSLVMSPDKKVVGGWFMKATRDQNNNLVFAGFPHEGSLVLWKKQ